MAAAEGWAESVQREDRQVPAAGNLVVEADLRRRDLERRKTCRRVAIQAMKSTSKARAVAVD